MRHTLKNKPELLAPAGSAEALDAAIAGGANAVYFGAAAFNARMNAANFDRDEIKRAIEKCRNFGVRSNITFNTLIYDREFSTALEEIEFLYTAGADALIIADLGLALEVKRRFPDIELHASTQMSVHSLGGAELLHNLGFDRVVVARELDRDMLNHICEKSPTEIEIFIHGALCVSHSGQCLFSSLVGGRSGNRGECAQPCRLPYSGSYPLSLKDNCLAGCFEDVLELGAASLKIEGRMKSPAYVYGVTSVYRRLIDEKRNAYPEEIDELAALFSRSGFTDGYFKNKISVSMNGIRTESDKIKTKKEYDFDINARKRGLAISAKIKLGEPACLTVTLNDRGEKVSAQVFADEPERAINAPLSEFDVKKNLTKLGATDFAVKSCETELDAGVMMPVSKINALRREAVAAIEEKLKYHRRIIPVRKEETEDALEYKFYKSARFMNGIQVPREATEYFDVVYLPLEAYEAEKANGVILPPVIFDLEVDVVREMLKGAKEKGAKHALIGNLGHISLAEEFGFECHGDFRLNVSNSASVRALLSLGLCDLIPSPELTLVRLSDLGLKVSSNTIIYGRVPMMLLEKCVIKQISGCEKCRDGCGVLSDRRGEKFPVYRTYDHRNIIYNSRTTYMADKSEDLRAAGALGGHFIFTDESKGLVRDVINAYKNGLPPCGDIRRIAKK